DVVSRDLLAGTVVNPVPQRDTVPPQGRPPDFLQNQIGRHRHAADGAFTEPLIGDVAETAPSSGSHSLSRHILSIDQHPAARYRTLTSQHLGEMFLAIAIHARDAEHFARP